MGKINPRARSSRIRIKQKKQEKLKKLKEKFDNLSKKQEKEAVLEKINKMAPYLNSEEYLKK